MFTIVIPGWSMASYKYGCHGVTFGNYAIGIKNVNKHQYETLKHNKQLF